MQKNNQQRMDTMQKEIEELKEKSNVTINNTVQKYYHQ
jgi:FtsZ-binding cell division protein ZapB